MREGPYEQTTQPALTTVTCRDEQMGEPGQLDLNSSEFEFLVISRSARKARRAIRREFCEPTDE